MNRSLVVAALCLSGVCSWAVTLRGDEQARAAGAGDLRAALVGTWKMTSQKLDGQKNDLPDSQVTYKHVTPAGFTWLTYEKETGRVTRAAGGTYTLNGDAYTETIVYGIGEDFEQIKKASHSFKASVEGDTWHHVGALAGGLKIDEEWTRVPAAGGAKP